MRREGIIMPLMSSIPGIGMDAALNENKVQRFFLFCAFLACWSIRNRWATWRGWGWRERKGSSRLIFFSFFFSFFRIFLLQL